MTFASVARGIITLAFVLTFGSPAEAICVTDGQGPCYRFWKAETVFVARVVEKEAIQSGDPFGGNYRLQVVVMEAFRGVRFAERLTLHAPDGVCGGVDARRDEELFIYASRNTQGELWASGCGVSKPVEHAAADLAYARSVTNQGPPAIVYGDVHQREDIYGDYRDFRAMSNVRVRVSGENFVAEVSTDDEGNYSITLPGAGAYEIEAIPPPGFVDRFETPVKFQIEDRRSCYSERFQLRLAR